MNTKHLVIGGVAIAAAALFLTRTERGKALAHSAREWLGISGGACCSACADAQAAAVDEEAAAFVAVAPPPIEGDDTIPVEAALASSDLSALYTDDREDNVLEVPVNTADVPIAQTSGAVDVAAPGGCFGSPSCTSSGETKEPTTTTGTLSGARVPVSMATSLEVVR